MRRYPVPEAEAGDRTHRLDGAASLACNTCEGGGTHFDSTGL